MTFTITKWQAINTILWGVFGAMLTASGIKPTEQPALFVLFIVLVWAIEFSAIKRNT